FFSKILYLYLSEVIISFIFLAVTAGVYSLVETDIMWHYYPRLLLIVLLIPCVSLIFSSILSIPVSYIQNFIKKNRLLLIFTLILIIGLFFFVYIQFINIILNFINLTSGSSSPIIEPAVIDSLRDTTNSLHLSSLFYTILLGDVFYVEFIIVF